MHIQRKLFELCDINFKNLNLKLSLISKNLDKKKSSKTRSNSLRARILNLPIRSSNTSIQWVDKGGKTIVSIDKLGLDSSSELGKIKFSIDKIKYRNSTISSSINGFIVTDIKGKKLPFKVAYLNTSSDESWKINGELSKSFEKLSFNLKNKGIPNEWKNLIETWIPNGKSLDSTFKVTLVKRKEKPAVYFSVKKYFKKIEIDNPLISQSSIRSNPVNLKLLGFFIPKTGKLKILKSHIKTKNRKTNKEIKLSFNLSKKDILNNNLSDPIKLEARLNTLTCNDFFQTLPEGLMEESKDFKFDGSLGFKLSLSIPVDKPHLLTHRFKPNFSCKFSELPGKYDPSLIRTHSLNVLDNPSPQQTAFMGLDYSYRRYFKTIFAFRCSQ